MRNQKTTAGRATLVALVLLLLAGAAGYNYHRNYEAEQAEQGVRPFQGYADQDLHDLKAAYRGQVDSRRDRYEQLAKRRTASRSGNEMLDENIANFERVQRAGNEKRAVAGIVAENQARLREIEEELAYRDYVTDGLAVHLKRLIQI